MRVRSAKKKLKKLIKEFRLIQEDGIGAAPANCVGGGAIASVGIPSSDPKAPANFAEPGVRPEGMPGKKKKLPKNPSSPSRSPVMSNFRRSPPKM